MVLVFYEPLKIGQDLEISVYADVRWPVPRALNYNIINYSKNQGGERYQRRANAGRHPVETS